MAVSRRGFLAGWAAGVAQLALARKLPAMKEAAAGLRVGICDWSIGAAGGTKALELAARIGLEGVQISPRLVGDKLSFAAPQVQKEYKEAVKATGVQVASLGLTVTNRCALATDPRGPAWLEQLIDATNALGCKPTLIAFFGRGDLRAGKQLKAKEVAAVVERLKAAAPRAKEKGVILGIENTLSAKDNLAILDRIGSEAVQVYYDIANSTAGGYDVPAEIRMLKGRICEFHFKNTQGLFGEAGVDLKPIAKAMREIDWQGWLILERSFGRDRLGYFQKNAAYIRKLFGLKAPAKETLQRSATWRAPTGLAPVEP